tara:strand:- start:7012 stop:7455 length:444 start_codon:yes stop_codon:yes gene_type:complete
MENLREIIRLILEKDEKIKSSGIVVVKDYGDEYKVLCLKRSDGSYDLTKGQSEEGESLFDTAVRETEEESGISDLRFEWGSDRSITYGKGKMFIASTLSEPFIPVNPETQIKEHESAEFLSFDEAEKVVDDYLKNAIRWARNIINKN